LLVNIQVNEIMIFNNQSFGIETKN
jgi:hypothetical protein